MAQGTTRRRGMKRKGFDRIVRSALGGVGISGLLAVSALGAAEAPSVSSPVTTVETTAACARTPAPFTGRIGRHLPESREAWPAEPKPPDGAPNVLIWLIDDAGFGLMSAFGGLAATPNLDRLAAGGLRYTNFHSTPLCSPSRVSLLTGRNPHAAHMGSHGGTSMGYPGYDGFVPPTAASTAKVLKHQGYSTMALGKWDHTPFKHQTPVGPFDLWPLGQGFDHFYGFLWHGSDHFQPTLAKDNSYLEDAPGGDDYYLTTDLADRAIAYVNSLHSVQPDKPFYLYWPTGAVHAPHQATEEWLAKYRGKFDMGWDQYRETVLVRQKKMGLVPEHTQLAPRQAELPPWDSLSPDEKKIYARQMEAIAAQMSQTDYEFGRIVDALKRNGQFENTIIFVTSDNGASAEGGPEGLFMELAGSMGADVTAERNLEYLDEWGRSGTMANYSAAWAVAANTPFRYYKQTAHDGGHHVPLIVSWPERIKAPGLRTQYAHIIDIAPTVLEAAGIAPPSCVDGVPQQPIDGIALNYSFLDARAPDRRKTQYYELWGNHGIYHDGWKAVVLHKRLAWDIQGAVPFSEDRWELYDVRKDPGETRDLSGEHPEKLKELIGLFEEEAERYNVYPLADLGARNKARAGQQYRAQTPRTVYAYPQPGVAIIAEGAAPPAYLRDYTISAKFAAAPADEGVIVAAGGVEAGYTLYAKGGKVHYEHHEFGKTLLSLSADLPRGRSETQVELHWDQQSMSDGTMAMLVNGREVAKGKASLNVIGGHGNNELFNIGRDTGTPVSRAYRPPFPFTGRISDVTVTLGLRPDAPVAGH
jgi:arylsulfatase A-like enzyme